MLQTSLTFATIFAQGFILSLSTLMPIGAQNGLLLRQGLRCQHVGVAVAVCCLCDGLLISAGIWGLGAWLHQNLLWQNALLLIGLVFLLAMAVWSLRQAWRGQYDVNLCDKKKRQPVGRVILMMLAVTLLNPHVYLDTLLILGSLASTYAPTTRTAFYIGAIVGAWGWFSAVGFGAQKLAPWFAKTNTWRALDTAVALILLGIAWGFYQQLQSNL